MTENGRRLRTISGHREGVNAIAFTTDGQNLISASSDRTVRFWETETGRPGLVLYGHKEPILDLALSPDGRRIVTASRDKTARIWNISPEGSSEVQTIDEETDISPSRQADGGSGRRGNSLSIRNPGRALVLTLKTIIAESPVWSPVTARVTAAKTDPRACGARQIDNPANSMKADDAGYYLSPDGSW
jgi:WD40 repeat protein